MNYDKKGSFKKSSFIVILLLANFLAIQAYGQVGIGTTSPQKDLHIGGANSTIRIDGLNETNNALNDGTEDNYNVVVDEHGDLGLKKLGSANNIDQSYNNSGPITIQTTANAGLASSQLYVKPFTVTEKALVVINYTVSIEFLSLDGSSAINDGRAKFAHSYFYLGDGTTADPSKAYGMTSSIYTNVNCDTASGFAYNTQSVTISMDPGTYSIHLFGAVYGGGNTSEAAFSGNFGNRDALDINVVYF